MTSGVDRLRAADRTFVPWAVAAALLLVAARALAWAVDERGWSAPPSYPVALMLGAIGLLSFAFWRRNRTRRRVIEGGGDA